MASLLHRLRVSFPGLSPEWMKTVFLKRCELDAAGRALPDFLVIGAQKSGSTSLFNYLCLHPKVHGSFPKEIFFLSREFERGERWYRRHFPRRGVLAGTGAITGEATTVYLCSAEAPRRAANLLPQAKLIAVLREPGARAVSHFHHRCRSGRENRLIDDVFSEETIARWAAGDSLPEKDALYFDRGHYASGLRRWVAHYPRDQILVLEAERMFAEIQATVDRAFAFLGLDPFPLPTTRAFNTSGPAPAKPRAFHALQRSFAGANRELRDLGFSLNWTSGED